MRRFLPTLLAALLFVSLSTKCAMLISSFSKEPEVIFQGPGEYHFVAPLASSYTLWHRSTASIDGIYKVRERRLPSGVDISVEHAGKIVPAKPYGSNYKEGSEGDRASILVFVATEPGDYLIRISGLKETRSFELTPGYGVGPIFAAIGWFIGAGFGFLIFSGLLILGLSGVFPKRIKNPTAIPTEPPLVGAV